MCGINPDTPFLGKLKKDGGKEYLTIPFILNGEVIPTTYTLYYRQGEFPDGNILKGLSVHKYFEKGRLRD